MHGTAAGLGLLAMPILCARGDVLYDSGVVIGGGRSVNMIFTAVQPLVVPEHGWRVTSIGTNGLTLGGPANPGLRCDVFQGSIPGPTGGVPIATCTVELPVSGSTSSEWAMSAMDVILPPGQYFVRWTENGDPSYVAMIRMGSSGEGSFSWRRDTGAMLLAGATALRIEGTSGAMCRADLDDDGDFQNGGNPDGAVTIDDLLYFLVAFEAGSNRADLDNGTNTGVGDQAVTIDDLLYFLSRFESGC
jgi:hypothetical protein